MAKLIESGGKWFYDTEEEPPYRIELDQSTFFGYEHRSTEHSLKDLVAVEDERDGMKFSHWRYDQNPQIFEQMMAMTRMIGSYVLRDTPFEEVEAAFGNLHSLTEDDFDQLLGGGNE